MTVVGNLLDNAIAAVAEEPPRRRLVRVTVLERPGQLTIEVGDWGSGLTMPVDEALAWGTTSKADHLGAGLALVNRIVTSAMGALEASRHSGGTTFTVRVPILGAGTFVPQAETVTVAGQRRTQAHGPAEGGPRAQPRRKLPPCRYRCHSPARTGRLTRTSQHATVGRTRAERRARTGDLLQITKALLIQER